MADTRAVHGEAPPTLEPPAPLDYAPDLKVPVRGRGVVAGQYVGIGDSWSEIEAEPSGILAFKLPADATAGRNPLRLGAKAPDADERPTPIPGSRGTDLALRPVLVELEQVGSAVVVTVQPRLAPGQQAALDLFERDPSVATRLVNPTERAPDTFVFALPDLPASTYIAVIEVDGVSSTPEFRDGRYAGPEVRIR